MASNPIDHDFVPCELFLCGFNQPDGCHYYDESGQRCFQPCSAHRFTPTPSGVDASPEAVNQAVEKGAEELDII